MNMQRMVTMNKFMDTDFIEPQGLFSINPQQVTKIEYYQNEVYFFFNNSEMAGMWLKFPNEEIARQSIENFKMTDKEKIIENLIINSSNENI